MFCPSRMTIDPRIPTMPGRSIYRVVNDQADIAPSAKRREMLGESHEGAGAGGGGIEGDARRKATHDTVNKTLLIARHTKQGR